MITQTTSKVKLLLGDCLNKSLELEESSIDLIFTDPPYGAKYKYLYSSLGEIAMRVLKPGKSLITYFGQYALPEIIQRVTNSGLKYNWICYVKHGGPNNKNLFMHPRHVTIRGKPLLWFYKGDKLDGKPYISDFVESTPGDKSLHKWTQGTVEAEHFIQKLTLPGEIVFDPFMGAGTTGLAARNLSREFVGIDIDPESFKVAQSRLEI